MGHHNITCHILNKSGYFETISCELPPPFDAATLLKNPALSPYVSSESRVFITPSTPISNETTLELTQVVFILGKARISPQQWRKQRLKTPPTSLKPINN